MPTNKAQKLRGFLIGLEQIHLTEVFEYETNIFNTYKYERLCETVVPERVKDLDAALPFANRLRKFQPMDALSTGFSTRIVANMDPDYSTVEVHTTFGFDPDNFIELWHSIFVWLEHRDLVRFLCARSPSPNGDPDGLAIYFYSSKVHRCGLCWLMDYMVDPDNVPCNEPYVPPVVIIPQYH